MSRVISPVLHLIFLTAIVLMCLPLSAWAASDYVVEKEFGSFMADVPVALIQLDADKMKADNPEIEIHITNEGKSGFIKRSIVDFDRYEEQFDSPYNFVVYDPNAPGAVPLEPTSTLLGYAGVEADTVVFSFTIPGAAILPDGEKMNVVLSYSNVRLQLREDATEAFKEETLFSIARGPLFRTGHNYTFDADVSRNGRWAYGILADVKMQVCYSDGTPIEYIEESGRKLTATFLYTITDLDVMRGDTWIFSKVYGATNHRNYSEQVVFDIQSLVSGSKIHAPSEPGRMVKQYRDWMDVTDEQGKTGVLFYPTLNNNDRDPGSFYSGFAAPVNNVVGAKYTIKSSGAHGYLIRTYLFSRPKEEQNFAQHKIQSVTVTEMGGTIQTTEYGGNHETALDPHNLESGDAILDPGIYTIPTGKTMTYTMRPLSEHMISGLVVRNDVDGEGPDVVNLSKKDLRDMKIGEKMEGELKPGEKYTLHRTGERTYNFTFHENKSDHYIEVRWEFDITVKKEWEDAGHENARPESITFELYENGTKVKEGVSRKSENWPEVEFTNLVDGHTYTVVEQPVPNYRRDKAVNRAIDMGDNTLVFKNVYDQEYKNVYVSKYWDDQDNQDGLRPEFTRIRLTGSVDETVVLNTEATLDASGYWGYVFKNVPKKYDGKEIQYSVEETEVPAGYTVQVKKTDGDFIITNTHVPETVDLHVVKEWSGDSTHPESRPSYVNLRLHNTEEVVEPKVVKVSAQEGWAYTFRGLPKYAAGKFLNYVVIEDVPSGSDYVPAVIDQNQMPRKITNVYNPGKVRVTVVIDWDDLEDQDGLRPSSVEVELLADGKPTGKKITARDNQNWYGIFDNLDKTQNGKKIIYSVRGANVPEYILHEVRLQPDSVDENSFIIPYVHRPQMRSFWVSKSWNDAGFEDKRPEFITVRLYGDGKLVRHKQMYKSDDWQKIEFLHLPIYEDGKKIEYVISEDQTDGYTFKTNRLSDENFEIINSYNPGKVTVEVIKAWHGHHNQDGIRPGQVKIHLLSNGRETGRTLVLNEENHWYGFFEADQWDESGREIVYTVWEEPVLGYTTVIEGSADTAIVVSNSHTPERVSYRIRKIWNDPGYEGKRPDEIGIRLYADGKILEARELSAMTGWETLFEHLPAYQEGEKIQYTLTEDKVPDYTGKVDLEAGMIENTYVGDKTADLPPTGDKSHLLLWLLGAFVGLAGIESLIKKRPPQ